MVRTSGSVSMSPRTSAASLNRSWFGSGMPDSGMSLAMIGGGSALVIRAAMAKPGCRTGARPDPDVDRAGVAHQVRHDQEVRRVSLAADDVDLEGRAVDVILWHAGWKATRKPGIHFVLQPRRLVVPFGDREDRHA